MNAKTVGLAIAWGLFAFAMLGAGATKLMADPMHVTNFVDNWGFGTGFMYFTGVVEVVTAVLLVARPTRFYGALLGTATMLGAFATHLMFAEWGGLGAPIVLGALAVLTAWAHRPGAEAPTGAAATA